MKKYIYLIVSLLVFISCSKSESDIKGNIYGVVTLAENGEPMRATGVELYVINYDEYGRKSQSLLLKTVTYDDGHYEFDDLAPGEYLLVVDASGYNKIEYSVTVEAGRTARADMQLYREETYMTVTTDEVKMDSNHVLIFYGTYSYQSSTYSPNEYGFVYGKSSNLNLNNGTKVDGKLGNNQSFSAQVNIIEPGKYYIRAYAKNKVGYAFGAELTVEISGLPDVETLAVTHTTESTATLNGKILYDGDPHYTEKGFVYSSSFPKPTIDDPQDATIKVNVSGMSSEFSANVSGLIKDKTYYVRAYAVSESGVSYGESVSFVAAEAKPYIIIGEIALQTTDLSFSADYNNANKICKESRVGGFSDWRLPTLGELTQMYLNKQKIGGFENGKYWSSNYTSNYYYIVDFANGDTSTLYYTSKARVRAVRSVN